MTLNVLIHVVLFFDLLDVYIHPSLVASNVHHFGMRARQESSPFVCACEHWLGALKVRKRSVPIFFETSRLEDYWPQIQQMAPFVDW